MVSSLISSIKGILERTGPDWVDITVGGITYRLNVALPTVNSLGELGDSVHLFAALHVRENSLALYGFHTEELRLAFEALIGINGVGPRLALSVLSRFTTESLADAVNTGNTEAFSGVTGVGKKMASRIVLELRGKFGDDWIVGSINNLQTDLIEALTALGYSTAEARQATSSLSEDESLSFDDQLRQALKRIGVG